MESIASQPGASLGYCLRVQWRVLHALLMREVITRFGRENLGVLWLVGEPVLFTSAVATLWSISGMHTVAGIPIVAFAITGYSSVLMWRNSAHQATGAIEQNKPLLYHRRVRVIDVLLTRAIVEIAGATGSFTVLSTVFILFGAMHPPADLLEVIGGWLLLAWFGASLAIVIGAAMAFSRIVEKIWHPTAYILFPVSGAAFMVDWLPEKFQRMVLLLPMVHGTEVLREGWFGGIVPAHYSVTYLITSCLVLSLAGLYLQLKAGRRIEH